MTIARTRLAVLVAAAAAVAAIFATVGDATSADSKPSNTSAPVISGTVEQGQSLQSSSGSWAGSTPMTFTYQWQRCDTHGHNCIFISGATGATYKLAADDVGHTIRSYVTAHNSAGTGTGQSNHTDVVTGASAPANTSPPTLSGTAVVGGVLKATTGSWTGTKPITYTYKWTQCSRSGASCSPIAKETGTAYRLRADDVGHTIRVSVRGTNSVGTAVATSSPSDVVTPGPPANTAAPTVSGGTTQGDTLTAASGTWVGSAPISYSYSWQRCDSAGNNCAAISGADAQTYVLAAADVGHKVRVSVIARNSVSSSHAESSSVGPVVTNSTLPPGAVKLADGTISIPAADISDNDRLTIVSVKYSSGGIHGRGPVTASVKVIDENKYVVSGALVYLLPAPRNYATHPAETPTGENGTASLTFSLTRLAPHRGTLMLFIRARTPQGDLLAGSSTRRLVQVHIFPS